MRISVNVLSKSCVIVFMLVLRSVVVDCRNMNGPRDISMLKMAVLTTNDTADS